MDMTLWVIYDRLCLFAWVKDFFFYVKNVDETKEVSMKYDFEAFFKAKWILEFF